MTSGLTNVTGLVANTQSNTPTGALVYISADTPGFTGAVGSIVWTASIYNDSVDPKDGGPVQRFWMGTSFTFATTDVSVANNTITKANHGWSTGECTSYFSSSGGLPGGMAVLTNYWVVVVDVNTIKLATSRTNAIAATPIVVDITTQGTGTHTCNRGSALIVPKTVTKVRMTGNVRTETDLTDYLTALIAKNTATYYGMPECYTFDYAVNLCSSRLNVAEGDIFHLNEEGGSAHTIDADEKATWLSIEVLA